jgi:hypothetical protein
MFPTMVPETANLSLLWSEEESLCEVVGSINITSLRDEANGLGKSCQENKKLDPGITEGRSGGCRCEPLSLL